MIREGDAGGAVLSLQLLLIHKWAISCGAAGADGEFGPDTAAAVRSFQTVRKLGVTGVVDAGTWQGPSGLRNHCRGENPLNQGGRGDLKSSRAFCGAWANGRRGAGRRLRGRFGMRPGRQKAAKANRRFRPMPAENAVFLCLICGTYAICPYCRHKTDGLEHFNFIKMMDINQNHHFFGFVHVCRCLQ